MTISITTTHIRQTVVADALEYALRECLFLLVYEYKDMFDHGVWAVLTKDDPPPAHSQLLCTINHEGRMVSLRDDILPASVQTVSRLKNKGMQP